MFKIIFVLIIIALYAHLYLHFVVNPNNDCSLLDDINKEDITNKVYVKQPFFFDATILRKELSLKTKNKCNEKHIEIYDLSYDSIPLLEPYVRFYATRNAIHFIKKRKWTDSNDSCRTFYRIHKGTFDVYCIHPKYKEFVSSKKEIKDTSKFIKLTLHQDSILFLPRSWYIRFDSLEKDSKIEKIKYFTPLNQVANAISKIIK
jgi:hypothetical protein